MAVLFLRSDQTGFLWLLEVAYSRDCTLAAMRHSVASLRAPAFSLLLSFAVSQSSIKLHVIGREETCMAAILSRPPVLVWELL